MKYVFRTSSNYVITSWIVADLRFCLGLISLYRFLYYSLNTTHITKDYSSDVIDYVSQNAVGKAVAWNFVRNEWDNLKEL